MDLQASESVALTLAGAIRGGHLSHVEGLLAEHPGLAAALIHDAKGGARTPLHVLTDWPGYFPNGPEIARLLIAAGADVNSPGLGAGPVAETPLHWAASSDDAEVAEVLLDAGANIEAPGGSIAGTPLANAVGYGCWNVARLLVARGATITNIWQAAALGRADLVEQHLASDPPPNNGDITEAFWQACHGGQLRVAALLLARGADINGRPGYTEQSPLQVAQSPDTRQEALVTWLREQGAAESGAEG